MKKEKLIKMLKYILFTSIFAMLLSGAGCLLSILNMTLFDRTVNQFYISLFVFIASCFVTVVALITELRIELNYMNTNNDKNE